MCVRAHVENKIFLRFFWKILENRRIYVKIKVV